MVSLRVSLRVEENFWLEEISEGNFYCRRRVAEKNVVIVTTHRKCNFTVRHTKEDKNSIQVWN